MTPTPLKSIPPGTRYVMDEDDNCYLLTDAVAAGGEVRGSAFYWPDEVTGTHIYERRLSKREQYAGKWTESVSVAAFAEEDLELWK